jgi:hypothetical protein
MLENTVRAWSGNLGMYALKGIDSTLRTTGAVKEPPTRPAWTLADWPVIQAFIAHSPSSGSSNIENFYKNWTTNSEVKTTYKKLLEAGKSTEAQALLKSEGYPLKQQQQHSALVKINKAIDRIYNSESMSADDKRRLVDNLYLQADAIAKSANKQMAYHRELTPRAYGGPVNAGQPYSVGEGGLPEVYQPLNPQMPRMLLGQGVFTPPAPGVIIPNRMLAQNSPLPMGNDTTMNVGLDPNNPASFNVDVVKSIERRLRDNAQRPQRNTIENVLPTRIGGVRG